MKNSTEIGKEYEWTYAGNGEFRLSKGGRELFLAYAAAESTDGRSIDTRHAKEDNVPEDGTPGKQFTFRTADGLVLREDLYLDEAGLPCVSCTLSDSCSREVTTRKLIPLIAYGSETEKTGLWKSLASEMLLVPYDNTMWSRYETAHLRPGRISYDLSELISGYSKKALLFGALDFDVWKNAVVCSAYDSRKLELRSGIADGGTHDSLPHGAVSGPRVTSSRFVVLYGGDYRDLLEQYGEAVSRMTSPLKWEQSVPFGWNSWSAHQHTIDFRKASFASAFIENNLQHEGYANGDNTVSINLDAGWTKMTQQELKDFVTECHRRGQKAGTYDSPFACWEKDPEKEIPEVHGHTFSEILLRGEDGRILPTVDGAVPMDVTHPVWKEMIHKRLRSIVDLGFDYIKLDFMSHGGIEGMHYDSSISTGRQALNMGYSLIRDALSEKSTGRKIFISLSIAPLFPCGYGHARRFSCDAFGCAEDVAYVLNAQTYAWWENQRLYACNDPDHICLKRSFCADRDSTPGEARARYTSAVIAGGVMMLSEDFSDAEGGKRARELATVREINELVISRTAFRPTGTAEGNACRVFTASSGRTEYLAVFNPEQSDCRITVTSGLTGSELHSSYTDLWSGRKISAVHGALEISFEGCDAMILRSDS